MSFDSLPMAVALVPVAAYLLMIGWIHLRGRPVMTSGHRDMLVCGFALTGLMLVGPMVVFFPQNAAQRFGSAQLVWYLLIALWMFSVLLLALGQRLRLVIYGGSRQEVLSAVREVVQTLDPSTVWLGQHARLPALGIDFEIDQASGFGVVQLQATLEPQHFDGWLLLRRTLARRLAATRPVVSMIGVRFLAVGVALLMLVSYALFRESGSMWDHLAELFRV